MIKIFNTFTNQKENFEPLNFPKVKIYVCGPTVYDDIHVGNARSAVNFDVIRKYLIDQGYAVTYVVNLTDIDDKIISKALKEKKDFKEVSEQYINAYFQVIDDLKIKRADLYPKATDHIGEMISFIQDLLSCQAAYVSEGDVYFSTKKFETYGKLSKKKAEFLMEGTRAEKSELKKSPADFALWKSSKLGEPFWLSPWGNGRPGWHLECSTMIRRHLGNSIDIHGGGIDLIFPHHENERAQCEILTGVPFVKYWVHNGFLIMDGEKMSKSIGNILKAKDAIRQFTPEVLRYFFLSAHYRAPLNYTYEAIQACQVGLDEFQMTFARIEEVLKYASQNQGENLLTLKIFIEKAEEQFHSAMQDDFNTPQALAVLFDLAKEIRRLLSKTSSAVSPDVKIWLIKAREFLIKFGTLLGIVKELSEDIPQEIYEQAFMRACFKKESKYQQADQIREKISNMGFLIEDLHDGKFRIFSKGKK
jgi:cysteinyl-tRNA synthetase